MGRPLSEVLAPGYETVIDAGDSREGEGWRKRKRGIDHIGDFDVQARGRPAEMSMDDRMKEITRILQLNGDSDDDEESDLEELYQDLYQHLLHFSVLDFTNKGSLNVFTLAMALQVGPHPKLEILELGMQICSEEEMETLTDAISMGHLPGLEFLNISDIQFDDVDQVCVRALAQAFTAGFSYSCLEHLHLVENDIADEGMQALASAFAAGHVSNLKHLNLYYNSIGTQGAVALAKAMESGNLSRLAELELSRNYIGDDGAEAIARVLESGKLPALDTLGLWMNCIEVKGATAMARALESGNLRNLTDLGILDFDDEGTMAVVNSFSSGQVRALEKIYFDYCEKQTAIHLAKKVLEAGLLPNLQELRLSYVEPEAVEAFISAFRNNRFLVANLQLDWDLNPEVQVLKEEFNRIRGHNIRSTGSQIDAIGDQK